MLFGDVNKLRRKVCFLAVLIIVNGLLSVSCQTEKKIVEIILQPCQLLLDKNDTLAAGKCYKNALHSNPLQADELYKEFDKRFFNKCLEYKNSKSFNEAIVCFEGLSILTPNSGNVRFLLAESYYEYDKEKKYSSSGDFEILDKAVESLEKGLKIKPNDAAAYVLYGEILEAKKDWQQASLKYSQAIKLNDTFAPYWISLAIVQEKISDEDATIESYERALALDPNNTISLYLSGRLYQKRGEIDKSILKLEKLAKINPDYEDVRQRLEILKKKIK